MGTVNGVGEGGASEKDAGGSKEESYEIRVNPENRCLEVIRRDGKGFGWIDAVFYGKRGGEDADLYVERKRGGASPKVPVPDVSGRAGLKLFKFEHGSTWKEADTIKSKIIVAAASFGEAWEGMVRLNGEIYQRAPFEDGIKSYWTRLTEV
jgi:hypothetical protein